MRKSTKIWLITAALLVIIGCAIMGSVLFAFDWDFKAFSQINFQTREHEINQSYKNITVNCDRADVKILPSDSEQSRIICYEEKNAGYSVSVADDTLVVELVDKRSWYEHIGFRFDSPSVTLYIPKGEYAALEIDSDTGNIEVTKYFDFESIDISAATGDIINNANALGDIRLDSSTGDITVCGISADKLDISVTTGDINAENINCEGDIDIEFTTGDATLKNIKCKNLIFDGNTGDSKLNDVIATGKLILESSTGDIELDLCDAAEISVTTSTGDVNGTLLTPKVFICDTSTGSIDVPKTASGGICDVVTSTGDINFEIV